MPTTIDGKTTEPVDSPLSPGGASIGVGEQPRIKMDAAPVASGGATSVTVGFQLVDGKGDPIAAQFDIEFAVFDDDGFVVPAASATLSSPTGGGSVLLGDGTNAMRTRSNSTGRFECLLQDANDGSRWLACAIASASYALDTTDFMQVTFAP